DGEIVGATERRRGGLHNLSQEGRAALRIASTGECMAQPGLRDQGFRMCRAVRRRLSRDQTLKNRYRRLRVAIRHESRPEMVEDVPDERVMGAVRLLGQPVRLL